MEYTTKLRAALIEALHMLDNPPQVEQPHTVIKHALLACMESYGPTMEMLEGQAAELAKAKAQIERLTEASTDWRVAYEQAMSRIHDIAAENARLREVLGEAITYVEWVREGDSADGYGGSVKRADELLARLRAAL